MTASSCTTVRPAEATEVHTRLLRCALAIDECRAYWEYDGTEGGSPTADGAFEGFLFGARSMPRVRVLLANMRVRFDAYPAALTALRSWPDIRPQTRAIICHWHLQLADPLYRRFTGDYLVARRSSLDPTVRISALTAWVAETSPERWTTSTRKQFASKLLSSALAAGLVVGRRDPRELAFPRVPDEALGYLLYLLRDVSFRGTLVDNPYLRSVGLAGSDLDRRLGTLAGVQFRRAGDVVDFGWRYPSLADWAEAVLPERGDAA